MKPDLVEKGPGDALPIRPRVLAVTDFYLPGYKGGGSIRTMCNLVDQLGEEFEFLVVTRDRDLGDRHAYANITPGEWHRVGGAAVYYQTPADRRALRWFRFLRTVEYDLLFLNSFFSKLTIRTLLLRRAGLIPAKPLILAPRGEFSPQALALKSRRKRWYLTLCQNLRLLDGIVWQASTEHERSNISAVLDTHAHKRADAGTQGGSKAVTTIEVGADLLPRHIPSPAMHRTKRAATANLVFLARVSRIKNLHYALALLSQLEGDVSLTIYGPLEDPEYWAECGRRIAVLPSNVRVTYGGQIRPDQVCRTLSEHDALLMPTQAENFGHAILESLTAGCPVIISDATPWRNLAEQKAGWDLPLDAPQLFKARLQQMIDMDEGEHARWRAGAQQFARTVRQDLVPVQANRELFARALSARSRRAGDVSQ